jgi:hypothetical protein
VPGALLGLDLRALLDAAAQMAEDTRSPSADNPGLWLGVTLGALARAGRDKLTLVIEPRVARLGSWIEQLVAESTGKNRVGVVPVDGGPSARRASRRRSRLRAASSGADAAWQRSTMPRSTPSPAPAPIIDVTRRGRGGLGAEFFRWEFATAICGAVLGINPFDEPNVTESKDNTRRVLEAFRRGGSVTLPAPLDTANLRRHLARASRTATTPSVPTSRRAARDAALRGLADALRDVTGRAVTVGYGPRFLHSTGQLHKGGAPIGCFIQLTTAHESDLPIPGWHESFGTLIDAQAAGDFAALEAHGLPVARVDLGSDPDAGLAELAAAVKQALATPLE